MTNQRAKLQFLNRGSPKKKKKKKKKNQVCLLFILFLYHYNEWWTYRECAVAVQFKWNAEMNFSLFFSHLETEV